MDYNALLAGIKKYGSSERDICIHGIGVAPELINENVILAPWWEPSALPGLGDIEYVSESQFASVKVWNLSNQNLKMTYIKTGIGAPVLMHGLLALGVTKCRNVLFIGSVGSLDPHIGIGDMVIPQYSISGDGASRYISGDALHGKDCFGDFAYPNLAVYERVLEHAQRICNEHHVRCHVGRNFSIDTVFAQFAHLDEILSMGCNVTEMETAAAFKAAKLCDIKIAALLSVSDNTVAKKSLISGRTKEENEYRKFTRKTIILQIIIQTFKDTAKA